MKCPRSDQRRARGVFCGLALLVCVVTGCRPQPGTGGPPAGAMVVQVVAADAKRQAVSDTLALVADIAANESVELKAETEGIVQEVLFEEGQAVAKDQLLLRLDDTKLAATLAEAEATFKLSGATFARSQQLLHDKLISQQEYDQAAASFDRTRAAVDLMRRQLRDAKVHAPFAGVVGARQVSPGQVITRATVLTTLVDLDPVKVEFYVPESRLSQAQVGQLIEITVPAYPGRKYRGKVYFISPKLDEATRRVLVKATIANPHAELKPGMFGNLELTVQLRESAVVIPELALLWEGDEARVFVVSSNQTAQLRPVKVGLRLPGLVEVIDGVAEGERVVTEGLQKVVPGAPVRVADAEPAAVGQAIPANPAAPRDPDPARRDAPETPSGSSRSRSPQP